MKRIFLSIYLAALPLGAFAQDVNFLKVDSEIRVDHVSDQGFSGNSLNLAISGHLSPDLSFHFKHRFNKGNVVRRNFDATDWIYLTLQADESWSFSAGKLVVALGGFEYNSAPVDTYFSSLFWSEMPCYKFGVSTTYALPEHKDLFTFQVCNSPYGQQDNTYAYNLLMENNHSWYNGKHSVSLMEYEPQKFIGLVAIGNEFRFGTNTLQADATFRYATAHSDLLNDYSLVGKFVHDFNDTVSVFAKSGYDKNSSGSTADSVIGMDTDLWFAGCGVEYYPIPRNRNVRIHTALYHRRGDIGIYSGGTQYITQLRQTIINIGLTWKINVLDI